MGDSQKKKGNQFDFFIPLSGILGLAATALPLYLYPIATFDPIQGGSFYQSSSYISLYVPYALLFAVSAGGLLFAKRKKIFASLLFAGFLISHFHFKWIFKDALVFKPAFVGIFIVLPAVIFLIGAIAAWAQCDEVS